MIRVSRGVVEWGEGAISSTESSGSSAGAAASAAMDRYANGHTDAFAELYDLLADRLYRFLMRRTRDAGHAEELLQQTFLQMHCARETYVTGGDVIPWAFCIARRLCVDAFRKAGREVLDSDGFEDSISPSGDPEDVLRTAEAARRFQTVLALAPEGQRAAFELTKLDGLSLAEAAEVLGTTVTAVKLRVHRIHELLREASRDDAPPASVRGPR